MEFGIAALGILALLSPLMGESIMGRTPLDGVLLFAAGIFALSSVASGHPLAASVGWLRLWIVVAYFGIFWWLPDAAAAARFTRSLVLAAIVAAGYGIVQHYTGIDWYRALLGRQLYVRPRITGASGFASLGFFRSYLTYAHVLVVPLGFALAATGGWPRTLGVPLLFAALLFSTARGAWIAAGAMVVTLVAVRHGGASRLALLGATVVFACALSTGWGEQIVPLLTEV